LGHPNQLILVHYSRGLLFQWAIKPNLTNHRPTNQNPKPNPNATKLNPNPTSDLTFRIADLRTSWPVLPNLL